MCGHFVSGASVLILLGLAVTLGMPWGWHTANNSNLQNYYIGLWRIEAAPCVDSGGCPANSRTVQEGTWLMVKAKELACKNPSMPFRWQLAWPSSIPSDWCDLWTKLAFSSLVMMACGGLSILLFFVGAFFGQRNFAHGARKRRVFFLGLAPVVSTCGLIYYFFLTFDFPSSCKDGRYMCAIFHPLGFGPAFWSAVLLSLLGFSPVWVACCTRLPQTAEDFRTVVTDASAPGQQQNDQFYSDVEMSARFPPGPPPIEGQFGCDWDVNLEQEHSALDHPLQRIREASCGEAGTESMSWTRCDSRQDSQASPEHIRERQSEQSQYYDWDNYSAEQQDTGQKQARCHFVSGASVLICIGWVALLGMPFGWHTSNNSDLQNYDIGLWLLEASPCVDPGNCPDHSTIKPGKWLMPKAVKKACKNGPDWCQKWKKLAVSSYVMIACGILAVSLFFIGAFFGQRNFAHGARRRRGIFLGLAPILSTGGLVYYFIATSDFPSSCKFNKYACVFYAFGFGPSFWISALLSLFGFSPILVSCWVAHCTKPALEPESGWRIVVDDNSMSRAPRSDEVPKYRHDVGVQLTERLPPEPSLNEWQSNFNCARVEQHHAVHSQRDPVCGSERQGHDVVLQGEQSQETRSGNSRCNPWSDGSEQQQHDPEPQEHVTLECAHEQRQVVGPEISSQEHQADASRELDSSCAQLRKSIDMTTPPETCGEKQNTNSKSDPWHVQCEQQADVKAGPDDGATNCEQGQAATLDSGLPKQHQDNPKPVRRGQRGRRRGPLAQQLPSSGGDNMGPAVSMTPPVHDAGLSKQQVETSLPTPEHDNQESAVRFPMSIRAGTSNQLTEPLQHTHQLDYQASVSKNPMDTGTRSPRRDYQLPVPRGKLDDRFRQSVWQQQSDESELLQSTHQPRDQQIVQRGMHEQSTSQSANQQDMRPGRLYDSQHLLPAPSDVVQSQQEGYQQQAQQGGRQLSSPWSEGYQQQAQQGGLQLSSPWSANEGGTQNSAYHHRSHSPAQQVYGQGAPFGGFQVYEQEPKSDFGLDAPLIANVGGRARSPAPLRPHSPISQAATYGVAPVSAPSFGGGGSPLTNEPQAPISLPPPSRDGRTPMSPMPSWGYSSIKPAALVPRQDFGI